MPIDVVRRVEGEKRSDSQHYRAKDFIADVEVVVGEAAAVLVQDAVIGIVGGKFGQDGAKGLALFHALEDEVDTMLVLALQPAEPGADVVFLAYSLLRPLDGDLALPGVRVDPLVIVVGPLPQHFFGDGVDAQCFPEEIDGIPGVSGRTDNH